MIRGNSLVVISVWGSLPPSTASGTPMYVIYTLGLVEDQFPNGEEKLTISVALAISVPSSSRSFLLPSSM